jgi:hypothetical protein
LPESQCGRSYANNVVPVSIYSQEICVELFRERPVLAVQVLSDILDVSVPDFDQAVVGAGLPGWSVPDDSSVVVVLRWFGRPVLAVIVELLRKPDWSKEWVWPCLLAAVRRREECPAALLLVCRDSVVAAQIATPIRGGPGWSVTPLVLALDRVPAITDPERAVQVPELGVISAMVHGEAPNRGRILHAMLKGIGTLRPELSCRYLDYVFRSVPESAKEELEALLVTKSHEYKSDFARAYFDQGRAEGRAVGKAEMILRILAKRGVEVTDGARRRVIGCADLDQLDMWGLRAVTATDIDDLFAEAPQR